MGCSGNVKETQNINQSKNNNVQSAKSNVISQNQMAQQGNNVNNNNVYQQHQNLEYNNNVNNINVYQQHQNQEYNNNVNNINVYQGLNDNDIDDSVENNENSLDYKNLPNYDLFEKFIKIKKVKDYLNNNIFQGYYSQTIDGIFKEIEPLLKQLFNRFGLGFDVITQKQTIDCRSYRVDITPYKNSQSLDFYFPLFFLNFWFYPPEAFHHKIIKKFIFCEELIITTSAYSQPRAACPEWTKTCSMLYAIQYQDMNYLAEVMHHELFHYFDFMVSGSRVDSQIERDWSKLNPSNFQYGSGGEYERVYMNIDKKDNVYFVSHYSMSQCCEDRAEIYSRLMTKNSDWINQQSKPVLKKIEKIKDFMKSHDPKYIGEKSNYFFEKLLNFLDNFYNNESI